MAIIIDRSSQGSALERTAGTLLVVAVGIALLQPRWVPVFLVLVALAMAAWAMLEPNDSGGLPDGGSAGSVIGRWWAAQPATLAYLAFGGYCAVTVLWSPTLAASIGKVSWFVLVVLTTALGVRSWSRLHLKTLDQMLVGIVAATVIGSLFIVHEVLRDQALTRAIYNLFPGLLPSSRKHIIVQDGTVTLIGPYVMNRNIGALNLLLWPALACVASVGLGQGGRLKSSVWIALLIASAAMIATLPSFHESSQIAVVVSVIVFAVAHWRLKAARFLVLAGWLTATLGMLPAVVVAHKAGLHENSVIPDTGQARIILWNFTAHKYLERPILGVGANATRAIDDDLKPVEKRAGAKRYADRTGQHSHNFYVQTWFELGAVGALAFLACGVLVWRAIGRLTPHAQPYALAGAASGMCLAAFTWGLWQEWYLSLFGLAIMLMALADETLSRLKPFETGDRRT